MFKQFYCAFVQFKTEELAQRVIEELRYPLIKGQKCRALPYEIQQFSSNSKLESGV